MAIAIANTSRENQKEVNNPDDNIIFLKNSFLNHFQDLKDPRIERTKDHLLIDIIAISILAVISGAEDCTAIETYGKAKEKWLKTFLELPNGIQGKRKKIYALDELECKETETPKTLSIYSSSMLASLAR